MLKLNGRLTDVPADLSYVDGSGALQQSEEDVAEYLLAAEHLPVKPLRQADRCSDITAASHGGSPHSRLVGPSLACLLTLSGISPLVMRAGSLLEPRVSALEGCYSLYFMTGKLSLPFVVTFKFV
jgi:hypothetical protein